MTALLGTDWSYNFSSTQYDTRETGLLLCLDMYLEASKYEKEWSVRKLGFVYNELASYNLNLISLEETIQVSFTFGFGGIEKISHLVPELLISVSFSLGR